MYPLPKKTNIPDKAHFKYVPETPVEIQINETEFIFIHHTAVGFKGRGFTQITSLNNNVDIINLESNSSNDKTWIQFAEKIKNRGIKRQEMRELRKSRKEENLKAKLNRKKN